MSDVHVCQTMRSKSASYISKNSFDGRWGLEISARDSGIATLVVLRDIKHCPYCGRRLDAVHVESEECWND